MVISHILGGLGNQMFQYAAGYALALESQQEHLVDLSDFDHYQLHNGYELERVFGIKSKTASPLIVKNVIGWQTNNFARKILRQSLFSTFRCKQNVVEPHFHFYSDFFKMRKNSYLSGYWQSEKYFKLCEHDIRKLFTFKEPLDAANQSLVASMSEVSSVGLHIRRGDYVGNKKNAQVMNICSLDYYRTAIDYVSSHVENSTFFIFSDDIKWVKENLAIHHPVVFVQNNFGMNSYKDMQLMSMCQHNIIANSSFSWWGAWLNSNPHKIVVAPQKWFVNHYNDRDLIPPEWVRL